MNNATYRIIYAKETQNDKPYLIHFGVKGMHWGIITKKAKSFGGRARTGNLSSADYALANHYMKTIDEYPGLSKREKEYVYSELDNNLTSFEKSNPIVSKIIGNFLYTAINRGHNDYKIIEKENVTRTYDTWDEIEDEVMREVIGNDWRDYDW